MSRLSFPTLSRGVDQLARRMTDFAAFLAEIATFTSFSMLSGSNESTVERLLSRDSAIAPPAGLCVRSHRDSRDGDRCKHRRVFRRECRFASSAAVQRSAAAGMDSVGAFRQSFCAVYDAGIHGLSKPDARPFRYLRLRQL